MGGPENTSQLDIGTLFSGFRVSQAIHVAARLGIADLLADGSRNTEELAEATGTHAGSLYRLLRALASVGVFVEEDGRRFGLTPMGDRLRTDADRSIAGWAEFMGRPYLWAAWANLLHSVRTGENAFRHVHGTDVWEYRSRHPDESEAFDRAMTGQTLAANRAVLDAYEFGRFTTVVDVGGGRGALLAAILAEHPALHGVLFDQAHVVAGADELLREAGVAERCRVVGGSFFDSVPGGGDAYLLKFILHDWQDEEAASILRTCRRAVPADGAVLVIERIVGPPNEDAEAKFSDLNMLVLPGGQERTREEWEALFAGTGFRLVRVVPTASGLSVIEAVPV